MMKKEKILFLSCWNPNKQYPQNGIFIRRHAHALQSVGEQVLFFAIDITYGSSCYSFSTANEKIDNMEVVTFSLQSRWWKWIYVLYPLIRKIIVPKIMQALQDQPIKAVVSNVMHPTAVVGHAVAQALHKPHIIIEHFTKTDFILRHPLVGYMAKNIYRKANLVVPVSHYLKKTIEAHVATAKLQIIPNVLASAHFQYIPSVQNHIKTRFVAIAHWHQTKRVVKRPDLIIAALAKFQQKYPKQSVEIEFIGDGNMLPWMKANCKAQNVKAHFAGTQSPAYIAKQLQQANYFLHASNIETFSVVTMEALACGVPVLASNIGAITELIANHNGILANNTVNEWTKGLVKLTNSSFDRAMISKKVQSKYDPKTIGKQLAKAIKG